jgi:protein SCO1/2
MKFSTLQKMLWGLTAIVVVGFIFLQVSIREEQRADAPAFQADFELTDHRGIVQTDEDFAGRWLLVFFGFANCPDVCHDYGRGCRRHGCARL